MAGCICLSHGSHNTSSAVFNLALIFFCVSEGPFEIRAFVFTLLRLIPQCCIQGYTVKSLIVSLQQSKIHVFGRVVIENLLNIFILAGFIFATMTPTRKSHK
jgi:hypothetical protein